MGSRRFNELAGIRLPGQSHAVGRLQRLRRLTATLSYLNASGDVEFGPEVKIEQEFGWQQLPPETEGGSEFRVWIGFEIQTRDQSLRDSTLVIATYPYSTDWFDWADFKPILKRSRRELLQPLRAPQQRVNEMLRSRSELATENLDSRSGRLTARVSLPTRTEGLSITARVRSKKPDIWTAFESSLNRRHGRNYRSDLWCFGACRQFEECREVLRVSPQAQRLLAGTEEGTLFNNRRTKGPSPFRQIGPTAKALRQPILESSIIKALAGSSPKLDKLRRSGKPPLAALLMERIYDDTMYNLVNRLKNEPDAGGRVNLEDLTGFADASETPDDTSFAEKVDIYFDEFRKRPLTGNFRHAIESWLDGDARDRIAACAALTGAHKAGHQLTQSFEGLLQSIADDRAEQPGVRQAALIVLNMLRSHDPPSD